MRINFRTFVIAFLLTLPLLSFADGDTGIVKCGYGGGTSTDPLVECTYSHLVAGVNDFLSFLIYYLATPLAVLLFGYAGITLIVSGGDPGALKKAKAVFTNTLIGYVVMLSAYLIMKLIFGLLFQESFSLLN